MSKKARNSKAPKDIPARLGPKADEEEDSKAPSGGGLSLRTMMPNAITAAALCAGLTGVRFAIEGAWTYAVLAVILAGVLDGMDGRIARLLNAQSRFGAELDSLADSLSFGMAPALILYMWALKDLERFGWFAALAFALCCALRLARFNARIDVDNQPHKQAGFLTGVPAPVAAGLAFTPCYLWFETGMPVFRDPIMLSVWLALIAVLMISNMATLSWGAIRPRRDVRLPLLALAALAFTAILLEPWWSLTAISTIYLVLMPFVLLKYGAIKRRRALAEREAG